MSGGFVKIYGSIVRSSVWAEAPATRIVWITMLALADEDGFVEGSVPGLARLANVAPAKCRTALEVLMAPDPESKTPDHDGRRIEKVEGGWRILNYRKYREMRTPKQVADAERQQRQRDRERAERDASQMSHGVAPEEEAEVESSSVSQSSAVAELLAAVPNPRAWEGIIAQAQDGMLGPAYRATATQIEAAALDYIAGNHHRDNPSPKHFRAFIRRAVQGVTDRPSRGGTGQRSADNARKALEDEP